MSGEYKLECYEHGNETVRGGWIGKRMFTTQDTDSKWASIFIKMF